MKVGDLVKLKPDAPRRSPKLPRRTNDYDMVGFVMRIDEQHYGSNTAYKISHPRRGQALRPDMVDIIAETADGIRDRVLVLWNDETGYEYCESTELKVISENQN